MGFKLPALQTSAGFSLYASPSWAANQAAWLQASGINQTILALKSNPALLAWTVGNEISLGARSGLSFVTNSATGVGAVRMAPLAPRRKDASRADAPPSRSRSGRATTRPGGPTCGRW
jgi:hypothetical protein